MILVIFFQIMLKVRFLSENVQTLLCMAVYKVHIHNFTTFSQHFWAFNKNGASLCSGSACGARQNTCLEWGTNLWTNSNYFWALFFNKNTNALNTLSWEFYFIFISFGVFIFYGCQQRKRPYWCKASLKGLYCYLEISVFILTKKKTKQYQTNSSSRRKTLISYQST